MESALLTPPPPVSHGPTWAKGDGPGGFAYPEHTLGWHILDWISKNLLDDEGNPFEPTAEQARFILWMYAVDERGKFIYREIVLQRLKGWGKDPLAAVIAAVEFVGPSRFAGWQQSSHDKATGTLRGQPIGKRHPRAWVQVAAVSLTQTGNTMKIFAGIFTKACQAEHGIDIGKEIIYAYGGQVQIQAVTSSPETMEGNRPTFVILNETHHWREKNNGLEMNKVIKRNLRKNKGGMARSIAITNAYDPQMDSVAQRRRETWENQQAGDAIKTGVMYDSLEAAPEALLVLPRLRDPETNEPLETEAEYEARVRVYLTTVIDAVKGDSWWLNTEEIVAAVLDEETSVDEARRFYYNQIVTSEGSWIDSLAVDAAIDKLAEISRRESPDDALRSGWLVMPGEEIVVFGDLSKSRDHSGLVGCEVKSGNLITLGHWHPAPGTRKSAWRAPRGEVTARVDEVFGRFNVVAAFFDPSHALADEDSEGAGYWDGVLDRVHRTYKDRLQLWAVPTGNNQHSVIWDMSSPSHQKQFVEAAEGFAEEIQRLNDIERFDPEFTIDGHPELIRHLKNAKEYEHPKGYGTSLWKGSRRGAAKIDLAVCAVGARMVRRMYLNKDPDGPAEPGRVLVPSYLRGR